ncbi:MAG TPA: TetR family transcriptional regulator, partial [Rhodoferax sp.]|nr:TetR family transcriptional regulator [Rhodoferax sp.]
MARRTKEDALATRELLLDAAERVFHRRGVSRTTLQEIAQDAGLTRGAIYWHFQNKGELFHAMMERVTLPMMARMTEISPADEDRPLEKIRRNTAAALQQ